MLPPWLKLCPSSPAIEDKVSSKIVFHHILRTKYSAFPTMWNGAARVGFCDREALILILTGISFSRRNRVPSSCHFMFVEEYCLKNINKKIILSCLCQTDLKERGGQLYSCYPLLLDNKMIYVKIIDLECLLSVLSRSLFETVQTEFEGMNPARLWLILARHLEICFKGAKAWC